MVTCLCLRQKDFSIDSLLNYSSFLVVSEKNLTKARWPSRFLPSLALNFLLWRHDPRLYVAFEQQKKDRLGTSLIRQLRPLFLCSTSYSRKRGKYLYSLLEKSQISLSFGGKWEYLGKLTITKTSWCRIMISFVDISSSLQALFTLIFRTFGFVSFFKRICVWKKLFVSRHWKPVWVWL